VFKAGTGRAALPQQHRSNDGYRAHWSGGFGLRPPEVFAVRHGTFAARMKQRRQLGIQHKAPRIITDQSVFGELRLIDAECLTGSSH
jgi:hypothetical protein